MTEPWVVYVRLSDTTVNIGTGLTFSLETRHVTGTWGLLSQRLTPDGGKTISTALVSRTGGKKYQDRRSICTSYFGNEIRATWATVLKELIIRSTETSFAIRK